MSNQLIDNIVETLNELLDECRSAKDDLIDLAASASDIEDHANTVEGRFDEIEHAIRITLDQIVESKDDDPIERSAAQAVLRSTREDIDGARHTLWVARDRLLHYAETFGIQIIDS